jgi:Acetokinase family
MTSTASKLVLVVNSGSSSLKFKLFNAAAGLRGEVSGLVERIGDVENSRIITTNLKEPNAYKTTVDRGVKASAHCPMCPCMLCADMPLINHVCHLLAIRAGSHCGIGLRATASSGHIRWRSGEECGSRWSQGECHAESMKQAG